MTSYRGTWRQVHGFPPNPGNTCYLFTVHTVRNSVYQYATFKQYEHCILGSALAPPSGREFKFNSPSPQLASTQELTPANYPSFRLDTPASG